MRTDDEAMMWVLASAIASEIHVDPEHGFPEGYGPVHLAKDLLAAFDANGLVVVWRPEKIREAVG